MLADDSTDDVQRLLNDQKRKELAERYGAVFPQGHTDLPAEVESEWLDHVEAFEREYENAEQMTVREFIGSPATPPAEDIADSELDAELNQLFGILTRNDITVTFPPQIDDREKYRFLYEDLLNEEMMDIRIPGMRHCFIYEELLDDDEDDLAA